jgi:hypothetical protein
MSLQLGWTSTIYGLLFVMICGLAAFSNALLFLQPRRINEPYRSLLSPGLNRDLGNLLLTILLLWAYFTYSQYIVMWSGDIKREVSYFTMRGGGWDAVAVILVVLGFFGPLLALSAPPVKASMRLLGVLAGWMLFIAWLNLVWMAAPELVRGDEELLFSAGVLGSFIAIGGVWRWAFLTTLASAPLVPAQDSHFWRAAEHATT